MRHLGKLSLLVFLASLAAAAACHSANHSNNNQSGQASGNANAETSASSSAPAKLSPQPSEIKFGSIEVTSDPPGARVLLVSTDEGGAREPQPKGLTPITITRLSPGSYTVDLEKSGYKFVQKEITVKENATTKVNAKLRKL